MPEHKSGVCQFNLLKLVTEGRAKYIYVRKIEMLSRNKMLLKYILHLYAINGVTLFTKKGRYLLENLVTTAEIMHHVEVLKLTVEEFVPIPYEYVKN